MDLVTSHRPPGAAASEPSAFVSVAERVLDAALERDPVEATYLGDHRYDGRLPDPGPDAATDRTAQLRVQLAELDALDAASLRQDDAVDASVLRSALAAELLDLEEI